MKTTMQFHNTEYPSGYGLFDSSKYHFGALHIQVASLSSIDAITERTIWNIGFSVDISGSMSDVCKDGRDKMSHIKHTLCGILRVFSNISNVAVNVYIQAFDSEVEEILDFVTVSEDNVEALIQKIQKMFPRGETNLRKPLESIHSIMTKRMKSFPTQKFVHIMLTDGEDTSDNTYYTIVSAVSEEFKNVFIGFGKTHNSLLMEEMSAGANNDYRFVDKLESSGLVYGEIIHDILYSAVESISISMNHGEIYDWRTDTWGQQIEIPSLSYSVEKTFHIRSIFPELATGIIKGIPSQLSSTENQIQELNTFSYLIDIDIESRTIPEIDLTKYIYRQKVQEFLFTSKNMNRTKLLLRSNPSKLNAYVSHYKTEIQRFFDHMKEYVQGKMLTDDPFWKVLLDDIYVAIKVFNRPCSHMYTHSRQNSQGRQQTYVVTNIDDNPPESRRKSYSLSQLKDADDLDEMENSYDFCCGQTTQHELSDSIDTSYQTPEIMKMMRDVSSGDTV